MEKKIFVNGTFDVIHIGHVRLLNYARSLGDKLHVGIDSDRRVTSLKGKNRPINSQADRKELLLAFNAVSNVIVFDSDSELESLIKNIHPDIMIVGSDWKDKKIIGSEYAKSLIFYDRIEPYSSTKILQCIADR